MRRPRHLTGEEKRLWHAIAQTAKPLKGRSPLEAPEPPAAAVPPAAVDARAVAPKNGPVSPFVPPGLPSGAARPPSVLRLHPIERPVRRRIGKGRIAIEDRIDLHGKTESVAHFALLGFLRQAQAAGLRHVLVITGRGASFGSQGVLKRALPHWFATLEFRVLVAGYETAERGHGGEGAFYVRVRRR